MNFSEEFNDFYFLDGVTYIEYDQLKNSNRFYCPELSSIKMKNGVNDEFCLPKNVIMFTARFKKETSGLLYLWLTNDERRSLIKKIERTKL